MNEEQFQEALLWEGWTGATLEAYQSDALELANEGRTNTDLFICDIVNKRRSQGANYNQWGMERFKGSIHWYLDTR